jgi:putative FmdB family regulatory protein
MPLYEYECEKCAHRFERIQKFSDPPVETCPNCSGAVRKLLSSPAIQFKGSGWYITDYAKKSSGSSNAGKDGGASAGSNSDSKSSSSSDSGGASPPTSTSSSSSSGKSDT